MAKTREEVEEEAIGWIVRLRDASAGEWEAFTAWLEADAAHRDAYAELALVDREAGGLARRPPRPIVPQAPPQPRARPARRSFLGWGAAGALAAAAIAYVALPSPDRSVIVETAPGERRSIALAGGARIDLNGSTQVIVDPSRPRYARLVEGEALFTVEHDGARPFDVEAGGALVRDLGTVFNVEHHGEMLEVGVAEGRVVVNPEREAVNLSPGMVLRKDGDEAAVVRTEADSVAGWRTGRLSYSSAAYSEIARDVSRSTGLRLSASREVASRRFSGVIVLEGDRQALLRRLAALLDVETRAAGDGWELAPSRP